MKRSAVLLNTMPAHARCSAHSDMPHKLAVILLSVMCISCVMTMVEETRWQQYINAGTEAAYEQGDYSEAVRQFQLALKEAEDFGEEDPRFAISLNNLAELYRAQGRYAEAEPIYKRSLAIREKTLGPEDSAVATGLNNLATLYLTQGFYDEAEPLFKRALAIYEKALGPEHPNVATNLNNLAFLYDAQGRSDEAEPMYKRALAIQEKTLGPEHPDVAASLNNLAQFYRTQGRNEDEERLLREHEDHVDAEILDAVDAAVTVAKKHGFQYDDSDSKNGRVVVTALWKGRPVTLTMRYFRKMGSIYIASSLEQPGDVYVRRGGQKIEKIFYPDLFQETTRRGITVYGDPDASP